jgi:predicted signal transduction protein with EAL and GGDEF domain
VFAGDEVAANPDEHEHLRRLVAMGVGVTLDAPDPGGAFEVLRLGLPIIRLRLRLPLDDGLVTPATAQQSAAIVDLARRQGMRTSITAIDTPIQESMARWAGADVGTGDQLGPVSAVPELDVRQDRGTLATVQRLTDAVHGRREHAWKSTGS